MRNATAVLLVALAALVVHLRATKGGFLFYDDLRYVVNNPSLDEVGNPLRFFTDLSTLTSPDSPTRDIYRPVRTLSYALLGKNAARIHWLALLLHAGSTALLMLLLLRAGLAKGPAAIGALWFGLSPATVETTAWICSLGDAWCGLFVLASVLFWARDRRVLAFLALVLALFSKEHAVVVPGLWLAWDWFVRPERPKTSKLLLGAGAGLAVVLGFLVFRSYVIGARMSQVQTGYGVWTSVAAVGWYAQRVVFPVGPTFDFRLEPDTFHVLLGLATLAGLAAGVWKGPARVRFGCAWFLMALVPVNNLWPVLKIPTADRFLYVPLMGAGFLLGEGVERLRPWSVRLALVPLALLAWGTIVRIGDWADDSALIQAGLEVNPKSKMLLWAEAADTADSARRQLALQEPRGAEMQAARAVALYGKYLQNTVPVEQVRAFYELGELLYELGQGRARYAPGEEWEAFRRSFEAFLGARRLQAAGLPAPEWQVRRTAERIVDLSILLADPSDKQLGPIIRSGLEAAAFLKERYGVDDTLARAKLRLVDGIAVRGDDPAAARRSFNDVLAAIDRLQKQGHQDLALTYLRAQALLYRSVLKDMDVDLHGLEEAYGLYLQVARAGGPFRPRALYSAARAACKRGELGHDPAWVKKGLDLLGSIPAIAQREGLDIDPKLAAEMQGLAGEYQ